MRKSVEPLLNKVEQKRTQDRLNKTQLAARLGFTPETYRRWLRGDAAPGRENYIALLEYLDNGK